NAPGQTSFVQTGAPTYVPNTDGFSSDHNGNNIDYSQKDPGYDDYPKFGDQFKNNRSEYVGISVNIPILNGFQARNNVRQAKLNLKNYELQNSYNKNY